MIRVLALVFGLILPASANANSIQTLDLSCAGSFVQGGFAICHLPPGSTEYEIVSSGNKATTRIAINFICL